MTDTAPALTLNAWMRWDLIGPRIAAARPASALELGPGAGSIAARIAAAVDRYVGVEPDEANRLVAAPLLPDRAVLVGDLDEVGDETFDLVCAFEVLEHLADDRSHLHAWVDRCRPGGTVLLSVPAKADRMGPHDELAGHLRRYERHELAALARHCGLVDVEVEAYGGVLGYPLEWARNTLARRSLARDRDEPADDRDQRTAASARLRQPPRVAGLATAAITFPFRLAQRPLVRSKMGTGFVLSGRRPI